MIDISSINGDGTFEEDISLIYPGSLDLTKKNEGNISANNNILDLTVDLNVLSNLFSHKLYDKRGNFKFSVVNYPD